MRLKDISTVFLLGAVAVIWATLSLLCKFFIEYGVALYILIIFIAIHMLKYMMGLLF